MKNNDIAAIITAVFMLGAAGLYYRYSLPITLLLGAIAAAAALYYIVKINPDGNSENAKGVTAFLGAAAFAAICLHLFNPLKPGGFFRDEWIDIIGSYMFLKGEKGFFSYIPASGSALPYVNKGIITALMGVTGSIAYLRAIPAAVFLLTCAAFYLLGREIKGRKLGLVMMFVYSVSSFSFYTAKQLMSNSYIPLFIAVLLLLFLSYVRRKNMAALAGCGIVFFSGFFTYPGWFFTVPFWAAAVLLFRGELGKKDTAFALIFMAASTIAGSALFLANPSTIIWTSHQIKPFISPGDILAGMLRIPLFFTVPLKTEFSFSPVLPLFSLAEYLLVLGGVVLLGIRSKDRVNALMLTGLIFTALSLFLVGEANHHLRHVAVYAFAVMVSALFLDYISERASVKVFMVFYLGFALWVSADMQVNWQDRAGMDKAGKETGEYVKTQYKNEKYLVLAETIPRGFLETALWLENPSGAPREKFDKVLLFSNIFMKDALAETFGAELRKAVYFSADRNRMPVVMYEIKIRGEKEAGFFLDLKKQLMKINFLLWDHEFVKAAVGCDGLMKGAPPAGEGRFSNTILRFIKMEACSALRDPACLNNVFYQNQENSFATADFYYYRAKAEFASGDSGAALLSLKYAETLAPWWDKPRIKAAAVREQLLTGAPAGKR